MVDSGTITSCFVKGGALKMTRKTTADFAPFEDRMRREGLPDIVIDNFRYDYDLLVAGDVGLIPEADIVPVASVPERADVGSYVSIGEEVVGRAVTLKLNGGLGTSMGLDKAKSLLVARDNLTFLDIMARQNLRFNARFNSH